MATSRKPRFKIDNPDAFFEQFPRLRAGEFEVTSPSTPNPPLAHNCFGYVVGERRIWWPEGFGYWPPDCRFGETIKSIECALRVRGFKSRDDDNGDVERGIEKIAIYALGETVTHVALQWPQRPGRWRSKIGLNVDIEHTLDQLEGDLYGVVVKFMYRKLGSYRGRRQPG